MDFEAISAAYSSAKVKVISAQIELDNLNEKSSSIREGISQAQDELDRLSDLEQQDHIKRVFDGENAAPKKPKRLARIANLREQIAGYKLALPVQEQRLAKARQNLSDAQESAGEAVLPELLELKAELFQACAEPLQALLKSLIEVAAFDDVQKHFAKDNGSIVVGKAIDAKTLFSAQTILTKFRQSLPERFKDLAADTLLSIDQSIAARSHSIIAQIGGQK